MSKANTRVIDLPSKQNPTGEEQIYIATETTDEKISLSEMREFLSETFVEKAENLSDIHKEIARENLQVYSKQEVEAKNTEQDTKIEANRVKNNEQDERLQTIEAKNEEQDERLKVGERINEEQNGRLQNIEAIHKEQGGKIEILEAKNNEQDTKIEEAQRKNEQQDERIQTLETAKDAQNKKIGVIEAKNEEQDEEIQKKINTDTANKKFSTKNHTHTLAEITDWNEKTIELLNEKIIAGQNVTITHEGGRIKITATGGGGGGNSGGGDMLKSIYDRDNDGKVDTAKTAESVEWNNVSGKPSVYTPVSHNHTTEEIVGLQGVLDGKANAQHTHTITQITGLQEALDEKVNSRDVPDNIITKENIGSEKRTFSDMEVLKAPTKNNDVANKEYVDEKVELLETKAEANKKKQALEERIGGFVPKEEGKGLSTNDFTNELKEKVLNFSGGFKNVSDIVYNENINGYKFMADEKEYKIISIQENITLILASEGGLSNEGYYITYNNGRLASIRKLSESEALQYAISYDASFISFRG